MNRFPKDRVPRVLESPLVIADQGSFYVGGELLRNAAGHTTYASHLYASFQKPVRARKYPLVMWHGGGQTGKTWESTADGREGYNTIWLRRDYSVFLVDEPYVGRGGKPAVDVTWEVTHWDWRDWESFRRGVWESDAEPRCYQPSQVAQDDWALAQLMKQFSRNFVAPGTPRPSSPQGVVFEALPYPEAPDAGAALLEAVGPSVLVSHSHGGFLSWALALRTSNVRGIVAYEPVRFIFPRGERPADSDLGIWKTDMPGQREAEEVPLAEFMKLTRFPMQLVYGDFLEQPGTNDTKWRDALRAAKAFQQVVNRHGGDVEVLELPAVGVRGNTHFPFADRNNQEVANLMADWLGRKALDVYSEQVTGLPVGDR